MQSIASDGVALSETDRIIEGRTKSDLGLVCDMAPILRGNRGGAIGDSSLTAKGLRPPDLLKLFVIAKVLVACDG